MVKKCRKILEKILFRHLNRAVSVYNGPITYIDRKGTKMTSIKTETIDIVLQVLEIVLLAALFVFLFSLL